MKTVSVSRLLLVSTLAAVLGPGCGDNNNKDTTPVDTSVVPTETTVLAQGDFLLPPSDGSGGGLVRATKAVRFTSTTAGTLHAQVDWTSPSNTVTVGLYPGGCTAEQLAVGACASVSEGSAPGKTAESRLSLYSAPQAYVLGIRNLGPGDEAGAFQVVLNH